MTLIGASGGGYNILRGSGDASAGLAVDEGGHMATVNEARATGTGARLGGISRGSGFAALILANALWAGTYTAGKIALGELSPVELNALRFTLAALVLCPVLVRNRRELLTLARDRWALVTLVQLILLGWVLNKTLEYVGLALSTAAEVALLISTESLFTAVLSWVVLRERVTRAGMLALVAGLIGAYLIVARGLVPNLGAGAAGGWRIAGDLLVILSLFVEAIYTVRGKTVLGRWPPLLFTALTITGSLVVWLPAGAIAVAHSGWPPLTLPGMLAVLYMAVVSTAIAYWLWFRGLSVVDGSAAAPLLFIQPLLGTALAVWLLHDALSWATLVGGMLILASLMLVMRGGSRAVEPVADEPVAGEPVP
jgi:drug/metabolite transporter (DMT)-like permease